MAFWNVQLNSLAISLMLVLILSFKLVGRMLPVRQKSPKLLRGRSEEIWQRMCACLRFSAKSLLRLSISDLLLVRAFRFRTSCRFRWMISGVIHGLVQFNFLLLIGTNLSMHASAKSLNRSQRSDLSPPFSNYTTCKCRLSKIDLSSTDKKSRKFQVTVVAVWVFIHIPMWTILWSETPSVVSSAHFSSKFTKARSRIDSEVLVQCVSTETTWIRSWKKAISKRSHALSASSEPDMLTLFKSVQGKLK